MVKMLTVLVSTIFNLQVFLLENMSSFCKSYSHFFFQQKYMYMPYQVAYKSNKLLAIFNDHSFNGALTNDIVSFLQLGQDFCVAIIIMIPYE